MEDIVALLHDGGHSIVIATPVLEEASRQSDSEVSRQVPSRVSRQAVSRESCHDKEHSESVSTYDGRGISDIFRLYHESPAILKGARVADKVVGKAVAAFMVMGGVREVYADVMSRPAEAMLKSAGIKVNHISIVTQILRRDGQGWCPMEMICQNCTCPSQCVEAIELFMSKKDAL